MEKRPDINTPSKVKQKLILKDHSISFIPSEFSFLSSPISLPPSFYFAFTHFSSGQISSSLHFMKITLYEGQRIYEE